MMLEADWVVNEMTIYQKNICLDNIEDKLASVRPFMYALEPKAQMAGAYPDFVSMKHV